MYQTIDERQFIERFDEMNRSENFTIPGRRALFDYLTDLEDDAGEPIQLDVIALCCDFSEYASIEEFHGDYDAEKYPDLDAIRDATQLIEIDATDGFIIGPL